jgi:hypothetical protein
LLFLGAPEPLLLAGTGMKGAGPEVTVEGLGRAAAGRHGWVPRSGL